MSPTLRTLALAIMAMALAACESGGDRFRIEGRFRNFNNGELYVYSADGATVGRDTVRVADGRFAYEVTISGPATFMIIFPNFSQQVVFGRPGATAKIQADASHLRDMQVSGTKDNERMTKFRLRANRLTPPEAKQAAIEFVEKYPESPVSLYLVNHYLISTSSPDYAAAAPLLRQILAKDPTNGRITLLMRQVEQLSHGATGATLPHFEALTTDSTAISRDTLRAKVNVITTWASWNVDSRDMQRELRKLVKQHPGDIAVVGVCLDASLTEAERWLQRDSIDWPIVCDGRMWDSPLLAQLGMALVPGVLIADKEGTIVARDLNAQRMREQIEKMLND